MSEATPVPRQLTMVVPLAGATTTVGPAISKGWHVSGAIILATLTGMSAGTLDLYIQESWNGGVAWNDVAHFTQVAPGAAAATYRISLATSGTAADDTDTPIQVGLGTLAAPGVALAAGKFVDGPWGPLIRLVAVTGAGTNAATVTQTITFYAWRPSQDS